MSAPAPASPLVGRGPTEERRRPAAPHDEAGSSAPSPSAAARLLLVAFRAYQVARTGRLSPCRFTPTCSEYAVQAVHTHGAGRGLALTARRLARCRPGGPFGPDPVPERG